jgi:hypothetical protein
MLWHKSSSCLKINGMLVISQYYPLMKSCCWFSDGIRALLSLGYGAIAITRVLDATDRARTEKLTTAKSADFTDGENELSSKSFSLGQGKGDHCSFFRRWILLLGKLGLMTRRAQEKWLYVYIMYSVNWCLSLHLHFHDLFSAFKIKQLGCITMPYI